MRSLEGSRWWVIVLCISVVIVAGGFAVATTATTANSSAEFAPGQPADPDQVFMLATVQPNGDAQWVIQYRLELSTENETEAFERLQADIEANRSDYLADFRPGVEATVQEAENLTAREMRVENLSVSTGTQQFGRYGVISYSFTWTNFATTEGSTIRAGDALAGLFLDRSTTLRFEWPSDYEATQIRPAADDSGDGYVLWTGERSFGSGEPRVVINPVGSTGPLGEISPILVALLLGVGILILAGVIYWRRRRETPAPHTDETTVEPGSDETDSQVPSGESTSETPDELLSNEERVLQLLEANGGRIKQQRVVEELDWTAAKTSQVVNGMREDGDIEVFRLGRENVIRLPDEEPLEGGDE